MYITQQQYEEIMDRLAFIEYGQKLLFVNDEESRCLFEYRITEYQNNKIADLLDSFQKRIEQGDMVYRGEFEKEMYNIIPQHAGNNRMCEEIVHALKNAGRWESVIDSLYGRLFKEENLETFNI